MAWTKEGDTKAPIAEVEFEDPGRGVGQRRDESRTATAKAGEVRAEKDVCEGARVHQTCGRMGKGGRV